MLKIDELLHELERLPTEEKWRLVRHMLQSLEQEQTVLPEEEDWHQFLRTTYGSLRDTPIQRWKQGNYENREHRLGLKPQANNKPSAKADLARGLSGVGAADISR